jgi:hypothetical protein
MDLNNLQWRKSRRSSEAGDHCVELADATTTVAVRDSKNPNAGTILLTHNNFRHLTDAIKAL